VTIAPREQFLVRELLKRANSEIELSIREEEVSLRFETTT
jgi:hypothetical protein